MCACDGEHFRGLIAQRTMNDVVCGVLLCAVSLCLPLPLNLTHILAPHSLLSLAPIALHGCRRPPPLSFRLFAENGELVPE